MFKHIKVLIFCTLAASALFVVYKIHRLYDTKFVTIAKELTEISGIEFDKHQRLWAINDGGDGAFIYHIQRDGSVERKILIDNARNLDWEDMTQDDFGHFFIGDFGNNNQHRDWLTIYKIENPIDIPGEQTSAEIIKFKYPSNRSAPANTASHSLDLEAFVYFKRKLYLFTKNRSKPFDGKTYLYKIGDHAANYSAELVNSFTTCTTLTVACWITSAALSPDRRQLVLLGSNSLWLFENWTEDDFFSGDIYQIDLGIVTQKEAVTFYDDNTLVFTDEEFKGIGRNAYVLKLDQVTRTLVSKVADQPSN